VSRSVQTLNSDSATLSGLVDERKADLALSGRNLVQLSLLNNPRTHKDPYGLTYEM
jgi:hypothetical protein